MFLKQSLSTRKLDEILASRPTVINHLVAYLEKRESYNELTDLLTRTGRYDDAGLVNYNQALNLKSIDDRAICIKRVQNNHFHGSPDGYHLMEHQHLLERLSPVIASDAKNSVIVERQALQPTSIPKLYPTSTVLETLFYLNYFHFNEPENLLHSPAALKKTHKLSEKQAVWVATKARALRFQWKDCEDLVLSRGWLGGRKARGDIDVSQVVKLLHFYGATADVLQKFLTLVDPVEEREKLAKKLEVHDVVVDVYVQGRDRVSLENYKAKLVPQSREWNYAANALISNAKWKN